MAIAITSNGAAATIWISFSLTWSSALSRRLDRLASSRTELTTSVTPLTLLARVATRCAIGFLRHRAAERDDACVDLHADGGELGLAQQQRRDRGGDAAVRAGAGADVGGDLPRVRRGRGIGHVRRGRRWARDGATAARARQSASR